MSENKIKPLRCCDNCGYLASDGYEYPEYYCAAGVQSDDPLCVGDGCIYTKRQLKLKRAAIEEVKSKLIEEWLENSSLDKLLK